MRNTQLPGMESGLTATAKTKGTWQNIVRRKKNLWFDIYVKINHENRYGHQDHGTSLVLNL